MPARSRLVLVTVAALLLALPAAPARPAGAADVHWTYAGPTGPQRWGALSPEFAACKTGRRQSPIDIRRAARAALAPITFAYQPSPLAILDNGHTIQVNYAPGSAIVVGGTRYELVQFHFHKPSEEKIDGRAADMDVHLVHRAADGSLAVVAVLLKKGRAHPLVQTLWTHVPPTKETERVVPGAAVDAARLLPADRAYYTFPGSLTTPPCTENVTWFVLRAPVEVSAREIAAFAKRYPMNARPVQPLNDRAVQRTR